MRLPRNNNLLERRVLRAALLSCCALALFALDGLVPVSMLSGPAGPDTGSGWREGVRNSVDSLFVLYGIDRGNVKTWQVNLPKGPATRTEQRITVSPGFVSVRFNHDLNAAVRPFRARVVATERLREDFITMHIVRSGRTVRSMVFVTDPGLRSTR
jgi:hypothetical protein